METPADRTLLSQNLVNEWSQKFGDRFISASRAQELYGSSTIGFSRKILGAVYPQTTEEVSAVVKAANQYQISLYTLSTGRNWGYGCALPTAENCIILDLSKMNKILEMNQELSYVTVEAGVTQQDLYDYFQKNNVDFMVPTTGAGPKASLIGNAMEKGYGITPFEDHFGAVLRLEAVLADGTVYKSKLHHLGGSKSDHVFKWKIGPYVEGLFAQGNVAIVTQASIALARRPEDIVQFFSFIDEENLEKAVRATSRLKQDLGTQLGGINLMNTRRVLSMNQLYKWPANHVLPLEDLRNAARSQQLPDWLIVGAIYSVPELIKGTQKRIRKEYSGFSQRTLFFSQARIRLLRKITKIFPISFIVQFLNSAEKALEILGGKPNELALPLAYLKNQNRPKEFKDLVPNRDNCGLLWYAPLIPMDPEIVKQYVKGVNEICLSYGIDPLITLTTISERCFDSTVPILFDLEDPEARGRARKCYNDLIEMTRKLGVFVYRLDVEKMGECFNEGSDTAQVMIDKIKKALDPNCVLSPGRYSSAKKQNS